MTVVYRADREPPIGERKRDPDRRGGLFDSAKLPVGVTNEARHLANEGERSNVSRKRSPRRSSV
jgi:hypothetical protein